MLGKKNYSDYILTITECSCGDAITILRTDEGGCEHYLLTRTACGDSEPLGISEGMFESLIQAYYGQYGESPEEC